MIFLCLFLFPGLLFIFRKESFFFDPEDFLKTLASVVFISLSFWVFSYWITALIPIRLSLFFLTANAAFIALFILLRYKLGLPETDWTVRDTALPLGIFLVSVCLRLVPAFNRITGSVGDMTQHNDMIRIILFHDGFSKTYAPLLPFSNFGEYPPGFHTLSALLTGSSSLPFYRAAQWMSAVPYALLPLPLYLFLARRFSKGLAMLSASLVLFASHYPQFLNQWGSAPTAFSAAFLIYGFYLLTEMLDAPDIEWPEMAAAALVLSAGLLSHLIPPVGFIFYFLGWMLVRSLNGKKLQSSDVQNLLLTAAISLAFLLPYIFNFNFSVFSSSAGAITSGHEKSVARITDLFGVTNPVLKFPAEAAALFAFLFGPALSLAACVCLFINKDKKPNMAFAAFVLIFLLLYACFKHHLVPGAHLFQTERAHYFILIPLVFLVGSFLKSITETWGGWKTAGAVLTVLLFAAGGAESKKGNFESHYSIFKKNKQLAAFFIRDCAFGSYWAYACDRVNAGVTKNDLTAFDWISNNTPAEAVFLVNYADGGHLISSLTGRAVTDPHGMDLWHGEELKTWQTRNPPTHIYIGDNPSPAYPLSYNKETLKAEIGAQMVYEKGNTAIFKIH